MLDELRLRNFSEITARLYIGSEKRFSQYFGNSPERLGPEQILETSRSVYDSSTLCA